MAKRYHLARKAQLATLTSGGGVLTLASGMSTALARGALGPAAVPLAAGGALLWLGRTMGEAFVHAGETQLRVKLGALFDETLDWSRFSGVEKSEWPLLGGLGVRVDLKARIAVVTTSGPVAQLTFREPVKLPLLPKILRIPARALVVSPADLDGFLADAKRRIAAA